MTAWTAATYTDEEIAALRAKYASYMSTEQVAEGIAYATERGHQAFRDVSPEDGRLGIAVVSQRGHVLATVWTLAELRAELAEWAQAATDCEVVE